MTRNIDNISRSIPSSIPSRINIALVIIGIFIGGIARDIASPDSYIKSGIQSIISIASASEPTQNPELRTDLLLPTTTNLALLPLPTTELLAVALNAGQGDGLLEASLTLPAPFPDLLTLDPQNLQLASLLTPFPGELLAGSELGLELLSLPDTQGLAPELKLPVLLLPLDDTPTPLALGLAPLELRHHASLWAGLADVA